VRPILSACDASIATTPVSATASIATTSVSATKGGGGGAKRREDQTGQRRPEVKRNDIVKRNAAEKSLAPRFVRQIIVPDCAVKVSIPNPDAPAPFVPALFVRVCFTPAFANLYQTHYKGHMGKWGSKHAVLPLSSLTVKINDRERYKQTESESTSPRARAVTSNRDSANKPTRL